MDLEKIATAAIESRISRSSFLRAYIDSNDKTPVWDGSIFVYRTEDINKKKEDLKDKVPVQVKGHFIKNIDYQNIKFRLYLVDIKKFYEDGGVVFFVVYTNGRQEKIYYNSLLPLDLARLIKKYGNQKSCLVEFKVLPVDEFELVNIFYDFLMHRKKQRGTLIPEILDFTDIEKIREHVEQFQFGFSAVNAKEILPFRELTTRDLYMYFKPKGIGNPIPFGKVSDAIIDVQERHIVSIKNKKFYDDAYMRWEKGMPSLICGKSIKITFIVENDVWSTSIFNIAYMGTLDEQLKDLGFMNALMDEKEFHINDIIIPDISFEETNEFKERLSKLTKLKQRLNFFGVRSDLNLDLLSEDDELKLEFLMDEYPSIEKYNLNCGPGILRLQIANISILLLIHRNKEQEYYEIRNIFLEDYTFFATFEDGSSFIISRFLLIGKEGLLSDNLDTVKIIEDIRNNCEDERTFSGVNTFLLEAIKAYDEKDNEKIELEYLIKNLAEWLYHKYADDVTFLNFAQVKYRLGEVDDCLTNKLKSIIATYKNNLQMLAGISIILNEVEEAKALINKMDEETKKDFMSYPIHYLLSK